MPHYVDRGGRSGGDNIVNLVGILDAKPLVGVHGVRVGTCIALEKIIYDTILLEETWLPTSHARYSVTPWPPNKHNS